jgi:hypothetical protein
MTCLPKMQPNESATLYEIHCGEAPQLLFTQGKAHSPQSHKSYLLFHGPFLSVFQSMHDITPSPATHETAAGMACSEAECLRF